MITITVLDVLNSVEPLRELIAIPMPAQTAYKFGKLVKLVNEEIELITDAIRSLQEKYPDQSVAEYKKEFDDLLTTEVKINFDKVSVSSLGQANVTPSAFAVLDWALTE